MATKEQELREEWNRYLYRKDDNTETFKLPTADDVANFWLRKREAELKEIREDIKKLTREDDEIIQRALDFYNQALQDVLEIIDEKLK
jgi:hypothetical protein